MAWYVKTWSDYSCESGTSKSERPPWREAPRTAQDDAGFKLVFVTDGPSRSQSVYTPTMEQSCWGRAR